MSNAPRDESLLGLTIILFREGEALALNDEVVVVGPGFEMYHQGRYIALDIYHSRGREREKESNPLLSARRLIIRTYMYISPYMRVARRLRFRLLV